MARIGPMFRSLLTLCCTVLMLGLASCGSAPKKTWMHGMDPDKTGLLVDGKAVPPTSLPTEVKKAVTAGNRIVGKPYRRGGGHAKIEDSAYDCSGTVSYVLYHAGLISSPTTSGGFRGWGKSGAGKHITVYAKSGHVFIDIAGLRLDTGYNGARGEGPKWSTKPRPTGGYVMRHPPGL